MFNTVLAKSGVDFNAATGAMIIEHDAYYKVAFGLIVHHATGHSAVEVYVNGAPSGITLSLEELGSSEASIDFIEFFSAGSTVQLVAIGGNITLAAVGTNAYFNVLSLGG